MQSLRWWRPSFEPSDAESIADVVFFSDREFPRDLAVGSEHGLPDGYEWPSTSGFARFSREREGWARVEPVLLTMRSEADFQIPGVSERLDCVGHALSVIVEDADSARLDHLRAIWAVARWAQSSNAFAMFDAASETWHQLGDLGDGVTDEFSLSREVAFVQESDADPKFGLVMQTRGMAKLARPDIVLCHVPPHAVAPAQALLVSLARLAADGERLLPGRARLVGRASITVEPMHRGINVPADLRIYDEAIVVNFAKIVLGRRPEEVSGRCRRCCESGRECSPPG